MPNHVEHDMVVSGPNADLRAFLDVAREGDDLLSANKFVPMPQRFIDERRPIPGGHSMSDGEVDWAVKHWGSKWGIYAATIDHGLDCDDDREIVFSFQSAWAPVLPVIVAMSRRFPTLFFDVHFFERGMQFQGHRQYAAGHVVHEDDAKYYGPRGG